jgi:hypothetical protein
MYNPFKNGRFDGRHLSVQYPLSFHSTGDNYAIASSWVMRIPKFVKGGFTILEQIINLPPFIN